MQPHGICIPSAAGDLAGRLYRTETAPRSLALISHGLYSSMQSEKLSRLARALAEAGHLTLIFDHAGCGDSPGEIADTTLSDRRDQLLAAVAAGRRHGGDLPLVYLGSSMGGTVSALAAERQPAACTLHWSTPWDFAALAHRLEQDPETPPLPRFAADLIGHDLQSLAGRLRRAFFVHGEADEVVPVAQAHWAHQAARPPKGLLILPGGDHRLSDPAHQERAIVGSLAWIDEHLAG